MAPFFTLRSGSQHMAIRSAEGIIILLLGWLGSGGFSLYSRLDGFQYEAMSYWEIVRHEWVMIGIPIFLFMVPAVFIASMIVLRQVSSKILAFLAVALGLLLTIPSFNQNIRPWNIAIRLVIDLPISQVMYSRWSGGFLGSSGMSISFRIADDDYQKVEQSIQQRLPQVKQLFALYLNTPNRGRGEIPDVYFFVEKYTLEGKRLSPIYDHAEFISSKGEIIGTIDIR